MGGSWLVQLQVKVSGILSGIGDVVNLARHLGFPPGYVLGVGRWKTRETQSTGTSHGWDEERVQRESEAVRRCHVIWVVGMIQQQTG